MKKIICDKCGTECNDDSLVQVDIIQLRNHNQESFDLCATCKDTVKNFIKNNG